MLDTFAGIGGFSYAATKLVGGYRTTQFIEIDPFCQKILKKHFPFTPIHDDIRTFTAIPRQYDVICGGFPCQSISVAGNRAGITEESRSGIFYELMRVIRMVRPRFVVLENVAAILNNGLDIVLGELSQAGYDAEWSVISASSLGACHRRSRWWCVAYTNDYGSPTSSISGLDDQTNNDTSQRTNQVSQSSRSIESADSGVVQPSTESTYSNSKRLQRENFSQMEREIWAKGTTRCLNADWRSYVSKPILRRGDDGLSYRVDRTKALGNSVVPQVAAIPLKRVHDLYYNE
jgi:DNA (cytosine-5)-methyltransferase 1